MELVDLLLTILFAVVCIVRYGVFAESYRLGLCFLLIDYVYALIFTLITNRCFKRLDRLRSRFLFYSVVAFISLNTLANDSYLGLYLCVLLLVLWIFHPQKSKEQDVLFISSFVISVCMEVISILSICGFLEEKLFFNRLSRNIFTDVSILLFFFFFILRANAKDKWSKILVKVSDYYAVSFVVMLLIVISCSISKQNIYFFHDAEHLYLDTKWNTSKKYVGVLDEWNPKEQPDYFFSEGYYPYEEELGGCFATKKVEILLDITDKKGIVFDIYSIDDGQQEDRPYLFAYVNGKFSQRISLEPGYQEVEIDVSDVNEKFCDILFTTEFEIKTDNGDERELSYVIYGIQAE